MAIRSFTLGDYYVRCHRTGFKVLRSECAREWNGLLVRRDSFETRHPQDFVRGRPEDSAGEDQTGDPVVTFLATNEVKSTDL